MLVLAALLLSCLYAAGQAGPADIKEVLVICSQEESSNWAQDMLVPIYEIDRERGDINFSTYFISPSETPDIGSFLSREEVILDHLDRIPDLTVLIGSRGYNLAQEVNQLWPGIPIILAGENDYYCPQDYTLSGTADPDVPRTSVSHFLDQGLNITLLHTPAMVEETVDLMVHMLPHMRKVILISDGNYQCRERQVRLERHLQTMYAHLEYERIFPDDYDTDELFLKLKSEDPESTGILIGSWLVHRNYMQTSSSQHQNVTQYLETILPVFTLFWCDLDRNRLIVGYDTYNHEEAHEELSRRVLSILDDGMQARDIPFIRFSEYHPTINWTAVESFHLDPDLIPDNAIVPGRPESFWNKYGNSIILAIVIALLIIMTAITAVLRHALQIQHKANREAEKANMLKTLFIQNMSHEIRTPMNAIVGFAQILGLPDGCNTESEKAEYLSYVMNNSNLLTVLIGDILSLSDMENGEYKVNLGPCNLNATCRLAIKSSEHRAQPGVEVRFVSEMPEDLRIETDAMRVQQILINLLTNACKHTQKGSIVLRAWLDHDAGCTCFSVTDTGPGVPHDKAEAIFERFVKLDSYKQGAGLGLNICKRIADSLGGRIWLDTSYTGGARFMLTIPSRVNNFQSKD